MATRSFAGSRLVEERNSGCFLRSGPRRIYIAQFRSGRKGLLIARPTCRFKTRAAGPRSRFEEGRNISRKGLAAGIRMKAYVPGVSGALVNYFGSRVRRPYPRIVAASKGTKVRVCLPQQSSLKCGTQAFREAASGESQPRDATDRATTLFRSPRISWNFQRDRNAKVKHAGGISG